MVKFTMSAVINPKLQDIHRKHNEKKNYSIKTNLEPTKLLEGGTKMLVTTMAF